MDEDGVMIKMHEEVKVRRVSDCDDSCVDI